MRVNVQNAAEIAERCPQTILRWIRLGELPATVGRADAPSGGIQYFIGLKDLIAFCARLPQLSRRGRAPRGESRQHPGSPPPSPYSRYKPQTVVPTGTGKADTC